MPKMKALIKRFVSVQTRRKILEFLNHLWCRICRWFSIKNRVLFYSIRSDGELLANSRVLYESLDCKKVVFSAKLPHSNLQKLRAYYLIYTSKVIVTDDYCRYLPVIKLKEEQKVFQIWHGCGAFKMFGLDAKSKFTKQQEKSYHSQYDYVAVTSEYSRGVFAGAFGIDKNKCYSVGLPKTDSLIKDKDKLKKNFFGRHPEFKDKTIYLYCPTFREKEGERIFFHSGIDFESLSSELKSNEVLVICRHPMMDYLILEKKYSNIIDLTDEDTTELCAASDVVITDYSSVSHDSTLMNIPMVFYCPDYKEYERGFYLKFPDDLPGEMICDPKELLKSIRKAYTEPQKEKMDRFREQQLSACDGKSTERITEAILRELK